MRRLIPAVANLGDMTDAVGPPPRSSLTPGPPPLARLRPAAATCCRARAGSSTFVYRGGSRRGPVVGLAASSPRTTDLETRVPGAALGRCPGFGHTPGMATTEPRKDTATSAGATLGTRRRRSGRASCSRRSRDRDRPALHGGVGRHRLRARPRLPGRVPVHARCLPVDVPRPAVDDAPVRRVRDGGGDERAVPLPARARPDGAVDGVRHADADGLRQRSSALGGRGRQGGRRGRLARRHGNALRRDPARRGVDVDDDQLAGGDPARLLPLRRRGAGGAAVGAARDDPDGHPEGVHRAEGVHLPAGAVDAARHRHGRVLRAGDAALASDLDLGLPHPGGGLDSGAGACVHARGRVHVRRVGARARPRRRRVRAAPVVLLQRASRLLRGDREVPGGEADLGTEDARPLRREGSRDRF